MVKGGLTDRKTAVLDILQPDRQGKVSQPVNVLGTKEMEKGGQAADVMVDGSGSPMGAMGVYMSADGVSGADFEQRRGDRWCGKSKQSFSQYGNSNHLRLSSPNKPPVRFELTTGGLQNRCATTAPQRQIP